MQRSVADDRPSATLQGPSPSLSCIGPYQYGWLRAFSVRAPAALSSRSWLGNAIRWRSCVSGRFVVVIGGDWKILLATHALILVPLLVFVSVSSTSRSQSVVLCLTVVTTLLSLWLTAFTDPGVVPAQPPPAHADVQAVVRESISLPSRPDRIVVERRWCVLCNLYRPARCVHCRFCNVCVLRRDHHCPWTGLCCGLRNYRFYVSFLAHVVLASLLLMFFTVVNLRRRYVAVRMGLAAATPPPHTHGGDSGGGGGGAVDAWTIFGQAVLATKFLEILLCVYALCGCVLVGSLLRYHVYLIGVEHTTTEDAKLLAAASSSSSTQPHGGGDGQASPFDRGSWLANAKALLWDPIPPSLLCAMSPEVQQRLAEVLRVEELKEEAPLRPSAFDPFVSGASVAAPAQVLLDDDDDARSADGAVMVRMDSLVNLVRGGTSGDGGGGGYDHDLAEPPHHHQHRDEPRKQNRRDEVGTDEAELDVRQHRP